jgi:hypothetical protein
MEQALALVGELNQAEGGVVVLESSYLSVIARK